MTYKKAKIWARLIHKGEKTILDVDEEYRDLVRQAYEDIFDEPCPEPNGE